MMPWNFPCTGRMKSPLDMQRCPGGGRIVLPALQHWSREVHNWSREVLAHKSQAPRQRASPADLGWAAGPVRALLVATFLIDYVLGYFDHILKKNMLVED